MTDRSVEIPGGIVGDSVLYPVRFDPAIGRFVAIVHSTRLTSETWSDIRTQVLVEARRSKVQERTAAIRRAARVGVTMSDLSTLTGMSRSLVRQTLANAGASPAMLAREDAAEEGVAAELRSQSS